MFIINNCASVFCSLRLKIMKKVSQNIIIEARSWNIVGTVTWSIARGADITTAADDPSTSLEATVARLSTTCARHTKESMWY